MHQGIHHRWLITKLVGDSIDQVEVLELVLKLHGYCYNQLIEGSW